MRKLSAKLQNELILAGHLVSVKGRWFISLDALKDVDGTPIVPEPDMPPEPPPSERDLLVAERQALHARQQAELEANRAQEQNAVHPEPELPAADRRGADGSADGDRFADRDRSKG